MIRNEAQATEEMEEKCNVWGREKGPWSEISTGRMKNWRLMWLQLKEQGQSSWEVAKVESYCLYGTSL